MIISFRNTEGGEVWYTTDGSKPEKGGENSTRYTEPFTIDNEKLINAALFTDDGKMSPVVNYSIEDTFTKGETRALLKHKADKSEVYTKAEVQDLILRFIENLGKLENPVWANASLYNGPTIVYDVTYGAGRFVAVGTHGWIAVSSDAVTWFTVSDSTFGESDIIGITYGGDKFVAVGKDGKASYSEDGSLWTAGSIIEGVDYSGVTYGAGRFVAVGNTRSDEPKIAYSNDGASWTEGSEVDSTISLFSVTYGGDKFVAVGKNSSSEGITLFSSDGGAWEKSSLALEDTQLLDVAYGAGRFVAVGSDYYMKGGRVATSLDGVTWQRVSMNLGSPFIQTVMYTGGLFVAGGATVTPESSWLSYSEDGEVWYLLDAPKDARGALPIYGLAMGGTKTVAVGFGYGGVGGWISYLDGNVKSNILSNYYTRREIDNALGLKVDRDNTYTKSELYTKKEIDERLAKISSVGGE